MDAVAYNAMNNADHIAELRQQLAAAQAARRQAEAALRERNAFESMLTRISTEFINLPIHQIDAGIQQALQSVSRFAGVDRGYIFLFAEDRATMSNMYEWCAVGIAPALPLMQNVPVNRFAWSNEQLLRGARVYVPRLADLPPEAAAEYAEFTRQSIQSLIAVPMVADDDVIGFLGFDAVRSEKFWPEESITLLHVMGQLLVNALNRRRMEAELRESRRMLADLMGNLPGMAYRCRTDDLWTMEFVSDGCIALTGYQPADLRYNRRVAYSSLIHPDDRERVQREVRWAIAERRAFQLTYRLIDAAGREKWVWEQGHEVVRGMQERRSLEGFITDISAQVTTQQQLEQRVIERTSQLTTLLEVQHALSSRLDPEDVMRMIAEVARQLIGASFGALFVREDDMLCVTALAGEYGPEMQVGYRMPLHESATGLALLSHSLVRINNLADERVNHDAMERAHIQSMIGVPLLSGDTAVGVISVGRREPNAFSTADAQVLAMLAPGALIALENARLYAQAQQMAALEERQRLVRDLHDVVTQTLFSASMIADVLPRLWERHPEDGRKRLLELRQLTRGALAEMRTLLLELRPAVLTEARLGDVLRQLAEAAAGRAHLDIEVTVPGELEAGQLPPPVQVAFYRVAQEALNNIVKHAAASKVALELEQQPGRVQIRICDNGRGFDPAAIAAGRLGLGIMQERAGAIGALFELRSRPGQGTRITMTWQQA
jgi:PAS domain S-box-containing protein